MEFLPNPLYKHICVLPGRIIPEFDNPLLNKYALQSIAELQSLSTFLYQIHPFLLREKMPCSPL